MLGKTVSHYEVLYQLGRGAVGEVYAARDTLLGRIVAIKVLHRSDLADDESRLRFSQEARAASALNHPSIVTIHDVIRDGDVDCIVMEYVAGQTLADRLEQSGPIPLQETLEILDRIADALSVAHARGIVHRDLKPANVMLSTAGSVKILDFGLAKIIASADMDLRKKTKPRTQTGIVIGTPSFMSPEQALGNPLDGRSDIFSVGTIAMEMLAGSNPFEADSVLATMHQIAYEEPWRRAMLKVPDRARGLVEKMLARDKEQRFQNADEVRMAIAAVRGGTGVDSPVDSFVDNPVSLRSGVAIAAAGVLIAAIGIGGTQLWSASEAASLPESSRAQMFTPLAPAQDHVRRGNELLSTFWRKGYVDFAIEEFQRAIALDSSYAAAHAGLAMAYWRRCNIDLDKEKAWLELSLKNARHAVELDPQLAVAHAALGVAELTNGNPDIARRELEQALVLDPANATAHRWLADIASRAKDDETAEAELRKALELQPHDAELHNGLGSFLCRSARYDQAAASFRQAIAIAPDYASPHRNLGAVLHMSGDSVGAARAMQRSVEIEPSASVYSNLGTWYFSQGRYPQSVEAFEKAVQFGANNHSVWANLGDAYRWTPGKQTKAREAFTTALHLIENELNGNPDNAMLRSNRALYYAKLGDVRNALESADALMLRKRKDPPDLYSIAVAFELSGARQKSLNALAEAIRNGYSIEEIRADPELASLRRDVQYQRMMVAVR